MFSFLEGNLSGDVFNILAMPVSLLTLTFLVSITLQAVKFSPDDYQVAQQYAYGKTCGKRQERQGIRLLMVCLWL
jgi:hypothetical protein